jgi:hypothetical protein
MKDTIEYKTLGEIADIIVGLPEEKAPGKRNFKYYCIQPSHLLDFNRVAKADPVFRGAPINDTALVRANDILIKRLSPSGINFLAGEMLNTFISGNVMIIRTRDNFNPKYVAGILESQGLPAFQHHTARGVTVRTISKAELQNVKLPLLPLEKQKLIGEIWFLSKEKQRLLKKLAEEETRYFKALLNGLLR